MNKQKNITILSQLSYKLNNILDKHSNECYSINVGIYINANEKEVHK